jgi:mono/diheme cytochrome c family protein
MRFIYGVVFALALAIGAGIAAVYTGAMPANADSKPSFLEKWMARTSLHATIARDAKGLTNPLQSTNENLSDGVKIYAANCAVCHGASDAKPSNIAQGLNIEAPQLAKDGVTDDPVVVSYWKIKHGIRFTGMPAFAKTLTDEQIWQVSMFVAQMDKLPPTVDSEWKAVPSAATPADASAAGATSSSSAPAPAASSAPAAESPAPAAAESSSP